MKPKDYLITALAPFALLWIPVVGNLFVEGWDWSPSDFVFMWGVLATTMFFYRLLATRAWANFPFRMGAALAVIASFLVTWVTLAVQIIGDDNPGNTLYLATVLFGMVGVGISRFQAATLARLAFAMAAILFAIPLVSQALWPDDFLPGFVKVCALNGFFVAMFVASGLCFRSAGGLNSGTGRTQVA